MTPKSLLIRLSGDCVSVCCLEFTFLEQSAQWSVPIVRMIMNENKLHVLFIVNEPKIKEIYSFL